MFRRACVLAAMALCLAPAASRAASAWLPPQPPISVSGTNASSPDVAMDGRGNVLAAWYQTVGSSTRVHVAFRPTGGAFGPPLAISEDGQTAWFPQVALDRLGNAIAVWSRYDGSVFRAQAAFRPAGGLFGAAQTVSPASENASFPKIAFDRAGNALMAWTALPMGGSGSVMKAAFRPAGGSFGDPDTISAAGSLSNQFDLEFDPLGNALVAWPRKASSDVMVVDAKVEAAVRPAGGSFAAPIDVSPLSRAVATVGVALDADGNALVTYLYTDTVPVLDPSYRMAAAFRPAGGTFGPQVPLSVTTAPRRAASLPDVAFDAQGNAVAVWMEGFWTWAASRPRGGSFATAVRISAIDNNTWDPRIAFDARGDAVAMWTNSGATGLGVITARRPAGSPDFGMPQYISSKGTQSYSNHDMAFDDEGNGVALWRRTDGSNERLEFAGFDGAGPRLGTLSIPTTGVAGTPLAFSADVLDVWSPVSAAWEFGDGTTATGASVAHAYAVAGSYSPKGTATDSLGNAITFGGSVAISAPPVVTAKDTVAPALTALRVSPNAFSAARSGPSTAAVGTTISYKLSEAAAVRLTVRRERAGRRVGKACLPATRGRRTRLRCTRTVAIRGALTHTGKAGTNRIRFRGRLAGRSLAAGRYELVARATDAAKNASTPRRVRFLVVRPVGR